MKKILNFIKNNYQYILFVLFLIIVNVIFVYGIHTDKFLDNKIAYIIFVSIINMIVIGVYAILFHRLKNIKIEKLYIMMIIPIGLIYMILFPLNTIPDENTHFVRVYEISSGHLVSKIDKKTKLQGRYFDSSLYKGVITANTYKNILKKMNVKSSGKKTFYHFANTALYSFVCYLPQTVGVLAGKILHLPILLQAYMARLFNFLVFVFLTYFAIKFMPMKKSSLFLIMFFPIVIQEAISLSPDALTIATTAFFVSYVLHLKEAKNSKITKKEITILTISTLVLSLCKIVYLPICLIIFLIPKEKFSSLKQKNIIIISIVLFAIITNLIWLTMSSNFLPATSGINSGKQLNYIIGHIIKYPLIIGKTYISIFDAILYNSFGSSLGCFTISISGIYIFALILIFIVTILFDNNVNNQNKLTIKKCEKWFLIFVVFCVIMLISTSLYLQWTPVGNDTILGIQGRYFIPLYMLLPLLFTKYKLTPKFELLNKYTYMFLISLNVYALSSILYYFL